MSDVTCPICGGPHEGVYRETRLDGISAPEFSAAAASVCGGCANAVANLYSIRHSGDPLTWARMRPLPSRYLKERIPQSVRWEVFRRDGFSCRSCGAQSDLTADHVHPEILGGEATVENLATLCRSCNSKKGARVDGQG